MVDLSYLKKFTKGDATKMKRYVNIYLNIAPTTFKQMQEQLKAQNWKQFAISAHSLKPQADYMGISKLKEILIEIEDGVKQEQFNRMEALFKKAAQIHQKSQVHLKEFLNTGN